MSCHCPQDFKTLIYSRQEVIKLNEGIDPCGMIRPTQTIASLARSQSQ